LMEFNIALCYERLGNSTEALRRYRLFLERAPNASNREDVQRRIARLEASSAPTGPAEETPRVSPKDPADMPPPFSPTDSPTATPSDRGQDRDYSKAQTGAPTDPELAKVAAIDVAAVRDAMGLEPPVATGTTGSAGPVATGARGSAGPVATGARGSAGPVATGARGSAAPPTDHKPVEVKPIYKEWWFWVVVGVGTVIVVDLASQNSSQSQPLRLFPEGHRDPLPATGFSLRF